MSLRVKGLQSGRGTEQVGFVGAFPGEAVARSAKVAIGCSGTINRTFQIEHIDKAFWPQIKVFAYQCDDPLVGERPVPKVLTDIEVGSATPMAYETCTSHRRASPAATMFFATYRPA